MIIYQKKRLYNSVYIFKI